MGQKLAHYAIKDLVAIVTIDHPPMNALDAAMVLAATIMKKAPPAVVAAKKVLNKTRGIPLAAGLELESDFWAALTATEDMKEGARAFIAKRKPEYKGT